MTKSDLLKAIAAETRENQATVDLVLTALSLVTSKALGEGDDVTIPGIAKLSTKLRKARIGRNPKTGEKIDIAAKTVVGVKVLKGLADRGLADSRLHSFVERTAKISNARFLTRKQASAVIMGLENWVQQHLRNLDEGRDAVS